MFKMALEDNTIDADWCIEQCKIVLLHVRSLLCLFKATTGIALLCGQECQVSIYHTSDTFDSTADSICQHNIFP